MAKTSNASIRHGLGLVSFGIIINFICFLVLMIVGLINNQGNEMVTKICHIANMVGSISWVVGLILCLLSGEKNFQFALVAYVIIIIMQIVFTVLRMTDNMPNWAYIIEVVLYALAHVAFLRGLRDVAGESKFNKFLLFACIVLYALAAGCLIYYTIKGEEAFISNSICYILIAIENVLFLVSIVLTHKSLKA